MSRRSALQRSTSTVRSRDTNEGSPRASWQGRPASAAPSRAVDRDQDRDRLIAIGTAINPSEPARREDMGSHMSSPHAGLIGNRYQPPSDLARCVVVHHGGELRCQGVDGRA